MIDTIKFLGVLAGLTASVFAIWHQLFRGRPIASITTAKSPSSSARYIRIKNAISIDIHVVGISANRKRYKVAKDRSTLATIIAVRGKELVAIINADDEKSFPIVIFPELVENEPLERVLFVVYWRKSSSTWCRQIPKLIATSNHDLLRMIKGQ